jgi:hypothetical protein
MPNKQDIDLMSQPNTVKLLHALRLAQGPATIRGLCTLSGLQTTPANNAMIELLGLGLAQEVKPFGSDRRHFRAAWMASTATAAELVAEATEAKRAAPSITPPRQIVHGENGYQGRELGCTVTRPGAMDAYNLPSLFMGQRRHRDGRIFEGAKP